MPQQLPAGAGHDILRKGILRPRLGRFDVRSFPEVLLRLERPQDVRRSDAERDLVDAEHGRVREEAHALRRGTRSSAVSPRSAWSWLRSRFTFGKPSSASFTNGACGYAACGFTRSRPFGMRRTCVRGLVWMSETSLLETRVRKRDAGSSSTSPRTRSGCEASTNGPVCSADAAAGQHEVTAENQRGCFATHQDEHVRLLLHRQADQRLERLILQIAVEGVRSGRDKDAHRLAAELFRPGTVLPLEQLGRRRVGRIDRWQLRAEER